MPSSSLLEFGFTGSTSTTQNTFILMETVSYYNFNHTNVYAVFIDASKTFDCVQYYKLLNELVNHNISPLVLRFIIEYVYKAKITCKIGKCYVTAVYSM